jgi:hypothetical protein
MRLLHAAMVFLLAGTGASFAAGDKVGVLSDVHAWVNRMPGAQAVLHVMGLITAPTPCHEAIAEEAAGSTATDFRIEVSIKDPPAGSMCIAVLSDIQFRFEKPADAVIPKTATVVSEADSKAVDFEEVH